MISVIHACALSQRHYVIESVFCAERARWALPTAQTKTNVACATHFSCVLSSYLTMACVRAVASATYCPNHTIWCVSNKQVWNKRERVCVLQKDKEFAMRVVYDVSFWAILTLTVINLVFGVIVDTFGDLRAERQVIMYQVVQ